VVTWTTKASDKWILDFDALAAKVFLLRWDLTGTPSEKIGRQDEKWWQLQQLAGLR